jgi:hypothetical protein
MTKGWYREFVKRLSADQGRITAAWWAAVALRGDMLGTLLETGDE